MDPVLHSSGPQNESGELLCFASWIEQFRHWNREITVFSQTDKED